MILRHRIFLSAAIAASVALAASVATAPAADAQTYPQGPGVASLSVANGSVVVVRGDGGAQVAATVNSPLLPGDYITTGPGSDAEVQYDGASMLRLAQNTQVRLVNLNPGQREAQLAAGTVGVAELQGSGGGPQLDTPSLTVRPNQAGDSRVSVLGNGQTVVTVRSGSAQIVTGNASQTLSPGSTLVASGPYGTASLSSAPAVGWDSFDQFNASRDQTIASAYNANPYISPQLAGYANLASYGQWQNVPGYGYSWAPSNQATFAPYQSGQVGLGAGLRVHVGGQPAVGIRAVALWDVVQQRAIRRLELAAPRLSVSVDLFGVGFRMGARAGVLLPHGQQCERCRRIAERPTGGQRVSELLQ